MLADESPDPPDNLVAWVAQEPFRFNPPIVHAMDRRWVMMPYPPPTRWPHFEYTCICDREKVVTFCHECADGQQDLYVGQCQRCETVVWVYRVRQPGDS